jgi:hypothetical protein
MSIPIRLDRIVVSCAEAVVRSRVPMGGKIWDFGGGELVEECVRLAGCPSEALTPVQLFRKAGILPTPSPARIRRRFVVDQGGL